MKHVFSAAILAGSIALAGLFIFLGMRQVVTKDRAVVAKGLSTRDVKADHVVWPLNYRLEGNNMAALRSSMVEANKTITKFLLDKGFEASDIQVGSTDIEDRWVYNYSDNKPANRYSISSTIIVSTDKVDIVIASQGSQVELQTKGLIVNVNNWEVDHQFNGLNELKPVMIEEATINARAVAQKFADDAECRLGSIRKASQGQFSIDADIFQPWIKHIRVVTTIEYYLD